MFRVNILYGKRLLQAGFCCANLDCQQQALLRVCSMFDPTVPDIMPALILDRPNSNMCTHQHGAGDIVKLGHHAALFKSEWS